jgi:hypothetical protein
MGMLHLYIVSYINSDMILTLVDNTYEIYPIIFLDIVIFPIAKRRHSASLK